MLYSTANIPDLLTEFPKKIPLNKTDLVFTDQWTTAIVAFGCVLIISQHVRHPSSAIPNRTLKYDQHVQLNGCNQSPVYEDYFMTI